MPRRSGTASFARRLGARIRMLRREAKLTQENLAWSCDLAKPYLSQVEAGKRLPSLPVLVAVAKRLGVEPADLLALNPKNERLVLLDALRRNDQKDVASTLRKLGYRVVPTQDAGTPGDDKKC